MTPEKSTMVNEEVSPHPNQNFPRKRARLFSRKAAPVVEKEEGGGKSEVVMPEKPADTPPPISFLDLFRYSTKFERSINTIGILAAFAGGAAQPLMSLTLLFGRLTQDFVNFTQSLAGSDDNREAAAHFRNIAAKNSSYLVYIGVALFLCTYTYMCIWVYTGEINAKRIRERYLKAVLRQDIAFFDRVGAGEVATRIQNDTHLIQQGISEKVAVVANFASAFLSGFIIAYVRRWQLALALTTMLPVLVVIGGVMNKFAIQYKQ